MQDMDLSIDSEAEERARAEAAPGGEGGVADDAVVPDDEVVYPPPMGADEVEYDPGSRSLPAPPVADVNLEVPFIHQLWDTSAWFNGHWACGPTSCTMILAYYGLLEPRPMEIRVPFPHTHDYGWYLANDFTVDGRRFDSAARTPDGWARGMYGSVVDDAPGVGWCAVASSRGNTRGVVPTMSAFLTPHDNRITLLEPSETRAKEALDAGHPLIVSGAPFGLRGHLMVIRGYYYDPRTDLHGWIVNDPYGYRSDGSRDYDGENVVYLWREIKPKYMYAISGPFRP